MSHTSYIQRSTALQSITVHSARHAHGTQACSTRRAAHAQQSTQINTRTWLSSVLIAALRAVTMRERLSLLLGPFGSLRSDLTWSLGVGELSLGGEPGLDGEPGLEGESGERRAGEPMSGTTTSCAAAASGKLKGPGAYLFIVVPGTRSEMRMEC